MPSASSFCSSKYQCSFSVCILAVVFCQIHLFAGWYQLVDPVYSPSGKSDQNNQQTYHKDRHVFFYHYFFPFGIECHNFFYYNISCSAFRYKNRHLIFFYTLFIISVPHMVCMSSGELFRYPGNRFLLSCRSLTFSDKIKAYTGDMPFFIFCIIPHIDSIFRNLTGFCDFFRSAWFSVQIKRNTVFPVNLQFSYEECLCRISFLPVIYFPYPDLLSWFDFQKTPAMVHRKAAQIPVRMILVIKYK